MKTPLSLVKQSVAIFGVFAVTAIATYQSADNGKLFISTPYATRNESSDALLSRLTAGKGSAILDGIVAKVKAKAETK
jgi:hypothetical protein